MSDYKTVIIETYLNTGGGSRNSIRARPIKGQYLDTSMNVECSRPMRKGNPVGSLFVLKAKLTNREGGEPFLYAHPASSFKIITPDEVKKYLGETPTEENAPDEVKEQMPMEPSTEEELLSIKSHYDDCDDLLNDFWLPCLKHCRKYDRSVGYFSSSILRSWISILPSIKEKLFTNTEANEFNIRLVTSPILNASDIDVLRELADSKSRREWCSSHASKIVEAILDDEYATVQQHHGASLFAYLIATEQLEIRFNFPQAGNENALHHIKEGVFYFDDSKVIAFSGSANESINAWVNNLEGIDVYRSWVEPDNDRIKQKQLRFERVWDIDTDNWKVVQLSPEVIEKLQARAVANFPDEMKKRVAKDEMKERVVTSESESSELTPWKHQQEAIDVFLKKERGILEMATGTGKTITTFWIIEQLWNRGDIDSVIVAMHNTALLNQWHKDLITFRHKLNASSGRVNVYKHYGPDKDSQSYITSHSNSILLCSRDRTVFPLRLLGNQYGSKILLVHDEVHALGSTANVNSLAGLSDDIKYRLGLSATPERDYDVEGEQNAFIENHIGPVIYKYPLENAIRDGILCEFDYVPLPYESSEEDDSKTQKVYAMQAARRREGNPMSEQELHTALANVHKGSLEKLPVFENYLNQEQETLERSILFVHTKVYGETLGRIIHGQNIEWKAFFGGEDTAVLKRFARGDLSCLVACHRVSEGIDIQDLKTVVLFSSAKSQLTTIQRIGRCLRKNQAAPNKTALVVDFIRQPKSNRDKITTDQEREQWLTEIAKVKCDGEE